MRAFLETEKAFETAETFAKGSTSSIALSDVKLLAPIGNPRSVLLWLIAAFVSTTPFTVRSFASE